MFMYALKEKAQSVGGFFLLEMHDVPIHATAMNAGICKCVLYIISYGSISVSLLFIIPNEEMSNGYDQKGIHEKLFVCCLCILCLQNISLNRFPFRFYFYFLFYSLIVFSCRAQNGQNIQYMCPLQQIDWASIKLLTVTFKI